MPTSSENYRLIGQLSTVGLSFVLALVLGFGGGYFLDRWLGSSPWLTFVGFFLGFAAGILNVYRVLGSIGAGSRGSPGSGGSARPPQDDSVTGVDNRQR